jgi:hypothetical protein
MTTNNDNSRADENKFLDELQQEYQVAHSILEEALKTMNKDKLEEALYKYANLISYVKYAPYLTVPLLLTIHNIEKMIEIKMTDEINADNSSIDSSSNNNS